MTSTAPPRTAARAVRSSSVPTAPTRRANRYCRTLARSASSTIRRPAPASSSPAIKGSHQLWWLAAHTTGPAGSCPRTHTPASPPRTVSRSPASIIERRTSVMAGFSGRAAPLPQGQGQGDQGEREPEVLDRDIPRPAHPGDGGRAVEHDRRGELGQPAIHRDLERERDRDRGPEPAVPQDSGPQRGELHGDDRDRRADRGDGIGAGHGRPRFRARDRRPSAPRPRTSYVSSAQTGTTRKNSHSSRGRPASRSPTV